MRALLAAVLALVAWPALAHPPPLGIPGFAGGFLHPVFVPAHLAALLGLGLLIGRQWQAWRLAVPAVYVVALIVGLGLIAFAYAPQWASEAVLALAAISGVLLAAAWALPTAIAAALALLTGLSVALDSPPQVFSIGEANRMLAGTALGGVVLPAAVAFVASRLTRPWQRIGLRIIGSWIAASAILVLALRFAG
jgi:urease accessory protein